VAVLDDLPEPWKDLTTALERWVLEPGVVGTNATELAARAGLLEEGLEASLGRLTEAGRVAVIPTTPPTLIHAETLEDLRDRAREILASAGETGVARAELVARLLPAGGARLREFVLADLHSSGVAREVSARVFCAGVEPLADPLANRVAEVYRRAGFAAPSPAEVASLLRAEPKTVEGLLRFLVDRQRLHRVGGRWILHSEVLDGVIAGVRSWGRDSFDVGEFKERFGLTRKLAIPILEWLDSQRVTRREGERRRVLGPRTGTTAGG
jgi:selenocysteine-specific elongation factor